MKFGTDAGSQALATGWRAASIIPDDGNGRTPPGRNLPGPICPSSTMAPGSHHHGATGPSGIDGTDPGSQPVATLWRAASPILDGQAGKPPPRRDRPGPHRRHRRRISALGDKLAGRIAHPQRWHREATTTAEPAREASTAPTRDLSPWRPTGGPHHPSSTMATGGHNHGGTGPSGIDSTDPGSQALATLWRAASIILDDGNGRPPPRRDRPGPHRRHRRRISARGDKLAARIAHPQRWHREATTTAEPARAASTAPTPDLSPWRQAGGPRRSSSTARREAATREEPARAASTAPTPDLTPWRPEPQFRGSISGRGRITAVKLHIPSAILGSLPTSNPAVSAIVVFVVARSQIKPSPVSNRGSVGRLVDLPDF